MSHLVCHLVCYRQNGGLAHKSIRTSQKVKQYFSVTGNNEVHSTPADLSRDFSLSEEVSHSHGACPDSDVTPGNESPGMSPGLLPSKLWACSQVNTHFSKGQTVFLCYR